MSQTRLFVQSKYLNLQVHKEVAHLLCSWLESVGPVQYIVCASSYHTLLIHDAIKAFPDAKVVGPGTKFNRRLSIVAIDNYKLLRQVAVGATGIKKGLQSSIAFIYRGRGSQVGAVQGMRQV